MRCSHLTADVCCFFFFKQKAAYELRISDWSSDVCSSDLQRAQSGHFEIWQQTLAAIAERPWFGHGSLAQIEFEMSFDPGRSPHNLQIGRASCRERVCQYV